MLKPSLLVCDMLMPPRRSFCTSPGGQNYSPMVTRLFSHLFAALSMAAMLNACARANLAPLSEEPKLTGAAPTPVTQTPDQAAVATMFALMTENARLATEVARLAASTPTPLPIITPNPTALPTESAGPTPIVTPLGPLVVAGLGKLAYLQGGDIWVKNLPDGEPRRLTFDGRNREPRWSPSGEWLAFRKDDTQVWVIRADGNATRPLNEGAMVGYFAWAPQEDRIAYMAGDELVVVNAEGTEPMTLAPQSRPGLAPGQVGRFAWNPTEPWIAYEWREHRTAQPPAYRHVWEVSVDGRLWGPFYDGGSGEIGGVLVVGWTSDGRFLLLQGDMGGSASLLADGSPLCAMPLEGGAPLQLVEAMLAYPDFIALDHAPANRAAVVVGGGRETWTDKVLHLVLASTGVSWPLTPPEAAVASPSWSPDGQRIAYAAMPDQGWSLQGEPARQALRQRRLWLVNAQGEAQPRQLTDDPAYRDERPLWSDDGAYLLFARLDTLDRASLWLIPAEGGEPHRIVEELTPTPSWFGYYGHVDWEGLFDWWRK